MIPIRLGCEVSGLGPILFELIILTTAHMVVAARSLLNMSCNSLGLLTHLSMKRLCLITAEVVGGILAA